MWPAAWRPKWSEGHSRDLIVVQNYFVARRAGFCNPFHWLNVPHKILLAVSLLSYRALIPIFKTMYTTRTSFESSATNPGATFPSPFDRAQYRYMIRIYAAGFVSPNPQEWRGVLRKASETGLSSH